MVSSILSFLLGGLLALAAAAFGLGALRLRRWRRLQATAQRLCLEGRTEEAVRVSEALLRQVEEVLPATDPLLAAAYLTHAHACHGAGEPQGAEDAAKKALRLLQDRPGHDPRDEGAVLQLLALALRAQGRHAEAQGTAELALAQAEENLPPGDARLPEYLVTLARTYQSGGRPGRARAHFELALELLDAHGREERAALVRGELLQLLERAGGAAEPSGAHRVPDTVN